MIACPAYLAEGPGLAEGTGRRTLVFLHGIGGNKEGWRAQLGHFAAKGYRAVAWDAPGYGDSAPLAELTWAAVSDSLATLLDALGVARAVVVGHSMGGMMAQDFAARHPDRLEALVLSGTSPAFGKPDGDWQKQFVAQRIAPLDAGKSMADLAPTLVAAMVGDAPDPDGVKAAVACMGRVPAETYRAYLKLLVTFDRRDALASIAVPTLVLAGEKDGNAPPKVMERMAEKIPGAVYHCLARSGHLANFEQPAAFDAAIDAFLSSLE